ncbi:MAG: glycosyltransferase [Pseudodesulfovibrio sp.]|nr:glycosyltransferase [Pseudodesulfovibrio sp.]
MTRTTYTTEAVNTPDGLADIRILINGKTWHLWGRNSLERETDMANKVEPGTLPVIIGAGLGHCLKSLLDKGFPVAVVDREPEINRVTGVAKKYANNANVLWIDDFSPQEALNRLTQWQKDNGNAPFSPVTIPLYQRLDREYYGPLTETLKTNAQADFWSQARYPKFQQTKPRILFLDSGYFLCGEILSSLKRLGLEHQSIILGDRKTGNQDFIESILKSVIDFKPDFVLTVNHFGMDRDGKLAELLYDLNLPLASWFVDNPHLILHDYAHPGTTNTVIFTFDAGNMDEMRDKGFEHVHYLPLATDPNRFKPGLHGNAPPEWASNVSFVGNSMIGPVSRCLNDANLPAVLRNEYTAVAREFGESGETRIIRFLEASQPEWLTVINALPTQENRLALESLLTWEATRQYRLNCVQKILEFSPLIVGDTGWKDQLGETGNWRHLSPLDYYEDLPRFYPMSRINFNCTSRQMIGAVNQRVFDVPACGGFVLTDHRQQIENLFDLETEAVVYHETDEIPDLIKKYLTDKNSRDAIITAARKRITAEHTYEIRLKKMIGIMRKSFT